MKSSLTLINRRSTSCDLVTFNLLDNNGGILDFEIDFVLFLTLERPIFEMYITRPQILLKINEAVFNKFT